jgi:PIN domain nuclease of toxin-antitoxin system
VNLLLDTPIYLWWLIDSPALPKQAHRMIEDADQVFVSVVSFWEAGIKWRAGKLPVSPEVMAEGISQNGLITLPVNLAHTLKLSQLSDHHRDPFDRMLVAQAMAEPMFLLTSDRALGDYGDLVRMV